MSNTKAKTLEAAPTIADSRRFVVWLAVPTVLLFAASCVFVLWVLFVSAERLNAAALEGERRLAVSAVDAGVQRLSKAVADYSFWDDMYEQFNGHYDPQWSRDNLDDYVLDAFEVDVVMVADAAGDLKYDYSRKGHGAFAVAEGDRQKLAEAVQIALRGWKPGQSSAVAGVLTFNGHPYVTAIGPISLSNEESIDPNKPPRLALAYLEALDGTWTAKISKTFGLETLRVVDAGPGTVALPNAFGPKKAFALAWTPADLGGHFLNEVFPMSLGALSFGAVVFLAATLGWIRIARHLTRALDLAKAGNAAKSEFLALMSHEIRTPLNGVLGMTNVLLDGRPDDEQRRGLLTIRDSGESLMRIINDVLDFSKLDAGRMDIEISPFDAHDLIRYAGEICAPRAAAKGIALNIDVGQDVPRFLRGDAGRIRQVLLNLLTNAIKFTLHGSVTLKARVTASGDDSVMLRVEVIDTGIGIAAERLPSLFTSFSQADASISRRFGGTGLGLAISKRLIELMNGNIAVASEPSRGSTFWFDLPLFRATPEAVAVQPSAREGLAAAALREIAGAGRSLRLLLVEDNATNQLVAKSVLNKLGFTTDVAANGLEAIAAVRQHDYDVVLMDVHMPEMDGIEATHAIRALDAAKRGVPIVALTANAFDTDIDRCLAAGMNGHVGKPFHKDDLVIAIAAALKGHASSMAAPKASAPVSNDAVDLGVLERFREENGDELLKLLIDTYLAEAAERLNRLGALLAQGQSGEEAARIAHSLKSSSAMAGATALSRRAAELEVLLRSQDGAARPIDPDELHQLFAAYRAALKAKGLATAA